MGQDGMGRDGMGWGGMGWGGMGWDGIGASGDVAWQSTTRLLASLEINIRI